MYSVKPNLLIGFHGCDEEVCHSLINHPNHVENSNKPYDWLGHGIYFWENNYERAYQWAVDKKKRGSINKPAVVGAILYLGNCLDLLDTQYIQLLKVQYDLMVESFQIRGIELPENKDLAKDKHKDKILRELDCTVIEFTHSNIRNEIESGADLVAFDSVRGVFTEGGPAFPGAGILEKNHIQVCIRNHNCIKGFFLPRKKVDFP